MKRVLVAIVAVAALGARADVEATPESQGVSSRAILKWIDTVEAKIPQMHSFVLRRHNKVVAEGWWSPYEKEMPHRLFSHSKTFTSTAAGFAADEGLLDLDARVAEIFAEKLPANPGESVRSLRVRDLLTMTTGGECDRPIRTHSKTDWVKAFLSDAFARRPGTTFSYNSCATYMVAEIVQKKTGRPMMDYLEEKLFRPLGMTDVSTTYSPSGCPCGGWGMAMKTEDLAKFGQLFLDGGVWKGKQIISRDWVQLATAKQVRNDHDTPECAALSDWQQGYGFQWWRCRHGCFRADGAGIQFTIVMPREDAVISVTALADDYQGIFNHIWEILLPAMKSAPLPADAAAQKALTDRCARLAIAPPAGLRVPAVPKEISLPKPDPALKGQARRWPLAPNKARYTALAFTPDAAGWTVAFEGGDHPVTLRVGSGAWRTSTIRLSDATVDPLGENLLGDQRLAAAGAWTNATFVAEGWFVNEAARGRLEIHLGRETMWGFAAYHGACMSERRLDFKADGDATRTNSGEPKGK